MNSTDLEKKFRQVIASKDSASCSEDQSIISILCATDWIRILVLSNQSKDSVTIEVELSPPMGGPGLFHDQTSVRQRSSEMIENLDYLLRLNDAGFLLRISEEDCLWTASLEVTGDLELSIFSILLPPGAREINC